MMAMSQKLNLKPMRLQGAIAVASFASGIVIASVCLFFIPPFGEIASSAISIVSELLVLCGAVLGVDASFDVKLKRFETKYKNALERDNMTNV